MLPAVQPQTYVSRPVAGSLYDTLDLILDKGMVIDAFVRVSLVGIELLTVDVRVVVASVDTYLRFAERVDRLVLGERQKRDLLGMVGAPSENKLRRRGALKSARAATTKVAAGAKRAAAHRERDDGMLRRVKSRLRDLLSEEEKGDGDGRG